MESDISYFRRRATEERRAALDSPHSQVRQAHLEMAERYEELVQAIAEREDRLGLGIVTDA